MKAEIGRRQADTACSSTHRVRLPREISALSYSGQFRTRYLKMKSDLRMVGIYLVHRWSRPIYATTPGDPTESSRERRIEVQGPGGENARVARVRGPAGGALAKSQVINRMTTMGCRGPNVSQWIDLPAGHSCRTPLRDARNTPQRAIEPQSTEYLTASSSISE